MELYLDDFLILLVDDRAENLTALQEILEKPGRKFLKAGSGNEALKQVLKHDNIGLIMLDVQMPGMDGFEVAHILKSNPRTRNISIIFVTAISKEEQNILRGFEEGAVDYLQKPLDIHITQAKVNVFEQLYFYQSHLKQSLVEIEKVNKQLEQFVYIVSHDLKSPLSSVVTKLSLLQHDTRIASAPDLADNVDMIFQATSHLNEMIRSILEYSRQSFNQQTIEEVNVRELVHQVSFLLFPPKKIRVHVEIPDVTIYTKKLKLQQVFQNLISNAIKYNDKPNGIIEVGGKKIANNCYEFYVRDNGPGIAEHDQNRIFKLFETTGNKAAVKDSSTGVGLNILKMLVEEQGGSIRVESELEKGSTFYFDWKINNVS